ncbi:phenylalanine--tRNA ligase subunit alpha [Candidatus Dependentiae bacterium]|nr:phenylalanine--tRNA ligase subunit alpha [Candidatus Dependentiae bacterium]
MNELQKNIAEVQADCMRRLRAATNEQVLEQVRIEFLGRNGLITQLMDQLKPLSVDEKKIVGPLMNAFKQEAQALYTERLAAITDAKRAAALALLRDFDVTAYMPGKTSGSLHPYTHIIDQLLGILVPMGFQFVQGPELEHEEVNFDALNIAAHHPARDMQDTIWLQLPHRLLRTHTSSVQIRSMQSMTPPFALVAPGRCYRNEATDASHDYVFMQLEGLVVGKDLSMATLLGTLKGFLAALFERDAVTVRVRPSYFPFVEPGIEVDMACVFCTNGCSTCKYSGWIEIVGAGLVHPHVLRACNIDPTVYNGFAFGFGLTRLTMLKYGIADIRLLNSNNLEFLTQF